MQKLIMKNFGPISDCEIDVCDYMVFIGPQASGKSTISKGIFFFKSLRDDLIKLIYEIEAQDDLSCFRLKTLYSKRIREKFLNYWGSNYHQNDMYIKYYYSNDSYIEIKTEKNRGYVDPIFSTQFDLSLKEINQLVKDFFSKKESKNMGFRLSEEMMAIEYENKVFFNQVKTLIYNLFHESKELLFIPAGRSLLATLSDQFQNINPRKLDFLMMTFVEKINNNKHLFAKSLDIMVEDKKRLTQDVIDFKSISIAQKLIREILKGEYIYDKKGEEKIYISKSKFTKINFSSSGQQEVIWILQLIFLLILERQGVFIVFEEPEAHLFPAAQKELVELISLLAGLNENQVIITTHSPYILTSMNNLIYAAKVGQTKRDFVAERIKPEFWISIEKFGAFYIDNGYHTDIIDHDLNLIKAETIDSASRTINEEFDFLFQLED